jgi:hypothetical protein
MTDGQSASLCWCQAPIWDPRPIFSLLSLIIFRQLRVHWCGAASLTRSRVCSFHLLLGIASAAFLRSESHGTHEHILLSLFLRLPQPGGPGSCIYFPQEQGSPVIPPGIGLPTGACSAYRRNVSLNTLLSIITVRLHRAIQPVRVYID